MFKHPFENDPFAMTYEAYKKIIQQIPNFDPDVFLDITGIDVREGIK